MHHDEAAAEPDNPKVLIIVVATAATIALVIGIVIGVNVFWEQAVAEQVALTTGAQDARLKALRTEEKQKLTNYAWIDKKAGVARLPLDRAVDLTLRDWKTRVEAPATGGTPPGGTAPTAAPPAAPGGPAPTGVAPGTPGTKPPTEPSPAPKHN